MSTTSIWSNRSEETSFPTLTNDITVDVAIIGGGITGITAASILAKAGKRVAVLEAWQVAKGTTGSSTGNLYAPVGERLHTVETKFNQEVLEKVAASRSAAIDFIQKQVQDYQLDCDFERVPWFFFTEPGENDLNVEEERKAVKRAGLPISEEVPANFPFTTDSFFYVPNQAQFNPLRYTQLLAKKIESPTCQIYENTKAVEFNNGSPCTVRTENGHTVTANQIIMATHTPKGIYGVHTTMGPYREYAIAARLKEPYPNPGIYWNMRMMQHLSIRTYTDQTGTYLLMLGEKHKVGQKEHNEENYQKLIEYIRTRFSVDSIAFTWSAQNYKPSDSLPFIGPDGKNSNIYIATGFSADGLTYGTLAAMIIADQIQGIDNPWGKIYDANRFTPVASALKFAKENINVAYELAKDYLTGGDADKFNEIKPGEGATVGVGTGQVAAYRDEQNNLHVVSAVCPHMGCIVHFNNTEKSWDCPCHGSRFSIDGEVLEGPAIAGLAPKKTNTEKG
ncbi:FAD-dependent oxidoreductase [Adhaeribacter aquaticus]|uniref:FAD-dependent oxidoreductase n=1 Tax=Adhaeribacter aquaticus TaxID=299567 RepID=UPI0003FD3B30|nr:FAD-dependent oxidoreductase [Adhaeribacter aquaticus]